MAVFNLVIAYMISDRCLKQEIKFLLLLTVYQIFEIRNVVRTHQLPKDDVQQLFLKIVSV